MSKSQLSTRLSTRIGTYLENGHRKHGLFDSYQSCHARAERWEWDPNWTKEMQEELEKQQAESKSESGKRE